MIDLNKTIKIAVVSVVSILTVIIFNPLSIVGPNERGVRIRFGEVREPVLMPGLQFHTPFIQKIETLSIVPWQIKMEIPVGIKGAITKDNQTIGLSVVLYCQYNEDKILVIVKNYTKERLKSIVESLSESTAKSAIGRYTISEIAIKQQEITGIMEEEMEKGLDRYPIILTDLRITNYDWNDEFDRKIQDTVNRAQEVLQKEQELSIANLEAQKLVAVAEAERKAMIEKAQGEKEKLILEGEGIKEHNELIMSSLAIELELRRLEIEKIRVERWNGQYVPNNRYGPIPFDFQGGVQGNE